ncbi:MAG: ParB/RepB/Spo0J family partition protein [Gammaproteobacteria bacterium]|nr:MAG: ParB/RepB/Spo0J family partition protein [Gammaproteobacteria bacterium]
MAAKKRGLGRGLEALLGPAAQANSQEPAAAPDSNTVPATAPALRSVPSGEPASTAEGALRTLPVDIIERGKYQPRVDMHQESLQDLADSISEQGVVQPIVVRGIGTGRYEIIAGERRWRAAQLAGLHEIPVVIRDVDDRSAIAIALIENIQRENLNPIEEARALKRLVDEFEVTHEEAAQAVGRSRAAVSNLLRLLDLENAVKEMVERRELEMGHARALLALSGRKQVDTARRVIGKGLTVRATERLVQQMQQPKHNRKSTPDHKDPNVLQLEARLSDTLGARVIVHSARGGKGRLEIHYNSLDELDGILEHIR